MAQINRRTGARARGSEWAVTVRFADGSRRSYFVVDARRDADGRLLEQWGRESQATLFRTGAEALAVARTFELNGSAKEYAVARLPPSH